MKHWVTINDPYSVSVGLNTAEIDPYTPGHNMIKAHASVYKLYKDEFKAKQKGLCYRWSTYLFIRGFHIEVLYCSKSYLLRFRGTFFARGLVRTLHPY